jgi:hypothetical protein
MECGDGRLIQSFSSADGHLPPGTPETFLANGFRSGDFAFGLWRDLLAHPGVCPLGFHL